MGIEVGVGRGVGKSVGVGIGVEVGVGVLPHAESKITPHIIATKTSQPNLGFIKLLSILLKTFEDTHQVLRTVRDKLPSFVHTHHISIK